jgi:hypothetical protein
MAIRTTLNLEAKVAQRLDEQAKARGLTRSQFVVFLAYRLMQKGKNLAAFLQVVRYQKRNPEAEWKSVHIKLEESDYVFLVEMRCFYKFSVSCLIVMALDDLLNKKNNMNDKNFLRNFKDRKLFNGHGMISENSGLSVCWRIFWNIPTNPKKIFAN